MVHDTKQPNTAIFTFDKEDHTLGNLLRATLAQNPHVLFVAYKVPHPLVPKFELRIQTDGTITPKQALLSACKGFVTDIQSLSQKITWEWELSKVARDTK